jgi:hypothetical protein
MSGGSLDYRFRQLFELSAAIRAISKNVIEDEFADHLDKCAKAAKALEWYYSGDGNIDIAHNEIAKIIRKDYEEKRSSEYY